MSTYALMRVLESAPRRYDRGLRLLTLGRVERAYERLAARIGEGDEVLDVGCGTGALALRAARRGARVKGIDVKPGMLEVLEERVREAGLAERVRWEEKGVAELDREPSGGYDAVTCGLCLSELSEDELRFALDQVARVLRPGGLLLVADEVRPDGTVRRWLHALLRGPSALLAYLAVGRVSRPVPDLAGAVRGAGLVVDSVRPNRLGSFVELVARKPGEGRG